MQITQKRKGHRCQGESGLVCPVDNPRRQTWSLRNRHGSVKCGHQETGRQCLLVFSRRAPTVCTSLSSGRFLPCAIYPVPGTAAKLSKPWEHLIKISSIPSTALSRLESFAFFRVSLHSSGAGLELETFLPQKPKRWEVRPAAPCPVDVFILKTFTAKGGSSET